jgi:molybdate transport system ATP-binding protein
MLRRCGLERLGKRRFATLSYGQKRLALLARALVQEPDWLLLDEFYNGLDAEYRGRIDRILAQALAAGQSWIAATHRTADVPGGTQGLIELRAGRVHAMRPARAGEFARLARQAGETTPVRSPRPQPKRGSRAQGVPLLRIRSADLYVDYRVVLRDVNFELRAGEHWAVFGANGAGKSSFLKLLYGDLSPAVGGSLQRSGFPRGTPIDAWKRQVGYLSPELQTDYAVNVTVADLVASGRYASIGMSEAPTAADRRAARRWLEYFGLLSVAKRRPRELSYGQMRRTRSAAARGDEATPRGLDEAGGHAGTRRPSCGRPAARDDACAAFT